jgi:hypothetical protein
MLVVRRQVGLGGGLSGWRVSEGEVTVAPDEPRPPVPAPQGQHKAPGDPAAARLTPRWVAPLYLLLAVCLLPWIVYIAWSLPARSASSSWGVAWAGFAAGLLAALAATGWAAWRRAWWVQAGAIATATLLVVDVWFDVVTASGGDGGGDRGGGAGELPLAALSLSIAWHASVVNAGGLEDRSLRRGPRSQS